MKKPIRIDIDIWNNAARYICEQHDMLAKFGELSPEAETYEGWAESVHDVATIAQRRRNVEKRINEKKRQD
jgi:hypothetical protein